MNCDKKNEIITDLKALLNLVEPNQFHYCGRHWGYVLRNIPQIRSTIENIISKINTTECKSNGEKKNEKR